MNLLPISGFPIIEPDDADPEVAQQIADVPREVELPYVPNWAKVVSISPGSLSIYLEMYKRLNIMGLLSLSRPVCPLKWKVSA